MYKTLIDKNRKKISQIKITNFLNCCKFITAIAVFVRSLLIENQILAVDPSFSTYSVSKKKIQMEKVFHKKNILDKKLYYDLSTKKAINFAPASTILRSYGTIRCKCCSSD